MTNYVQIIISVTAFLTLFFFVVYQTLTISVVQFSWSTQECVTVVWGDGTCADLPERYSVEWVK